MLPSALSLDLITCLSAAPSGHARHAANVLLGREMVAFLARWGRRHQPVPASHPVFSDLDAAQGVPTRLGSLLEGSKAAPASQAAAQYHLLNQHCYGHGVAYVQPGIAEVKAPYLGVVNAVVNAGTELVALVRDEMGLSAFAAARAPLAEHAQAWATQIVAMYGVMGEAGPGEAFSLQTRYVHRAGYGHMSYGSDPALSVPSAGAYSYGFHAVANSSGTSNPTSVVVTLDVGGVDVESWSTDRPSANPAEFVEVGELKEFFLPGVASQFVVDDGAKKIRIMNGSAHRQTIGGIFVLWAAA